MAVPVMIVEDYPLMREQLEGMLERYSELNVCASVGSGEEALELALRNKVEMALIDVSLPGMNGLELISKLRELLPELRCLVLSGHSSAAYVARARSAGAYGYVAKGDLPGLKAALVAVASGEYAFPGSR